ncbi:MAG: hypothetical protein D4R84_13795, partial [Rhodocyclaceae bacterium]
IFFTVFFSERGLLTPFTAALRGTLVTAFVAGFIAATGDVLLFDLFRGLLGRFGADLAGTPLTEGDVSGIDDRAAVTVVFFCSTFFGAELLTMMRPL